jgi:ABC-type transporter Mla subunit MlaD
MTHFFAALLVVGVGAVTAGCSSEGTSSSEGTDPPAVCSSTDALQASMADLRDVQVVENGTAALEDAVASVRSDLQRVVDDASSQYATQVDDLQSSFDALQAAAGAARDAPSSDTLNTVTLSVRALADDVSTFADDVASMC